MKHLVDVDDELLADAMRSLGTSTIKATVNEALRVASEGRRAELRRAIDQLAEMVAELPVQDRSSAW